MGVDKTWRRRLLATILTLVGLVVGTVSDSVAVPCSLVLPNQKTNTEFGTVCDQISPGEITGTVRIEIEGVPARLNINSEVFQVLLLQKLIEAVREVRDRINTLNLVATDLVAAEKKHTEDLEKWKGNALLSVIAQIGTIPGDIATNQDFRVLATEVIKADLLNNQEFLNKLKAATKQ